MSKIEAIKQAIVEQHLKDRPLMDVEKIRREVLDWLRQLKYPAGAEGTSWEDGLRIYPPGEGDKKVESGLKVRLALTLQTARNTYLISIMECLASDSREVYILSAFVNWQKDEKRFQEALDRGYLGRFEDVLRARHTVWAQTFRENELHEALDACARALLGNELVGPHPESGSGRSLDDGASSLSPNNLPDETGKIVHRRPVRRPVVPLKDFPPRSENLED